MTTTNDKIRDAISALRDYPVACFIPHGLIGISWNENPDGEDLMDQTCGCALGILALKAGVPADARFSVRAADPAAAGYEVVSTPIRQRFGLTLSQQRQVVDVFDGNYDERTYQLRYGIGGWDRTEASIEKDAAGFARDQTIAYLETLITPKGQPA